MDDKLLSFIWNETILYSKLNLLCIISLEVINQLFNYVLFQCKKFWASELDVFMCVYVYT